MTERPSPGQDEQDPVPTGASLFLQGDASRRKGLGGLLLSIRVLKMYFAFSEVLMYDYVNVRYFPLLFIHRV